MAKITRKNQKIFGSTAGPTDIGVFGSLAAASPAYTTDPETIQSLSNYLTGWLAAVVGGNSPAIEDMNALCYLFAYQLAYLFQTGVAEWNSLTTYYIGSLANDGTGNIYASLTNSNTNNALTDTTKWSNISAGISVVQINPFTQSPYTLTSSDNGKTFEVDTSTTAMQFNLPAAGLNFNFRVKDKNGSADTNNITVHRVASEKIENLASDFIADSPYGTWLIACDGTDWSII